MRAHCWYYCLFSILVNEGCFFCLRCCCVLFLIVCTYIVLLCSVLYLLQRSVYLIYWESSNSLNRSAGSMRLPKYRGYGNHYCLISSKNVDDINNFSWAIPSTICALSTCQSIFKNKAACKFFTEKIIQIDYCWPLGRSWRFLT